MNAVWRQNYRSQVGLPTRCVTTQPHDDSFAVHLTLCLWCAQFNFVGRILGPRGMTAKQLEMDTGCKIMVRGKGSMRDKVKVGTCVWLLLAPYMVTISSSYV